jgi:hypothetical protein
VNQPMSSGWRVWFAFETRPGITNTSAQDRSAHWHVLADSCRGSDGKIDAVEFDRWLTCFIEHAHLWGNA